MTAIVAVLLCLAASWAVPINNDYPIYNGRDVAAEEGLDGEDVNSIDLEMAPDSNEENTEVQGDMIITNPPEGMQSRNAFSADWRLWPDDTLLYEIDSSISAAKLATINDVIRDYEQCTCIRFREVTAAEKAARTNYVKVFGNLQGCFSQLGYAPFFREGYQRLSIGDGCNSKGTVAHEFMHALGVQHEQTRADRDNYITIDSSNIEKRIFDTNFAMYDASKGFITHFPYDYASVMHYGPYAFALDRSKKTIHTKRPGGWAIGQRKGFSEYDLALLNEMYGCDKSVYNANTCPGHQPKCEDSYHSCGPRILITYRNPDGSTRRVPICDDPQGAKNHCQKYCGLCDDTQFGSK